MNMISSKYSPKDAAAWLKDERTDRCEHVQADPSLAYVVHKEADSFGPVDVYVCCQPCDEARERVREEVEKRHCADCGAEKKLSETREWRWYDFYAAQGDEPVIVCVPCWSGPKHAARRAEDKAEREWERRQNGDY